MPFEKGKPKTGGRQKGVGNKRLALDEICQAHGLDVFEEMVKATQAATTAGGKFGMLCELAQYLYPKRKATELTVKSEIDKAAEEFNALSPAKQAEILEIQVKKLRGEV